MMNVKEFQQWLMLVNQGIISIEDASGLAKADLTQPQPPQIIEPTPQVMARMGIPYPIPAAEEHRLPPQLAAFYGFDPAIGRDEAVFRVTHPQYVGTIPPRRDIQVSSPQNPGFTVWESVGMGIHNRLGLEQVFVDWTPDPASMMFPPSQADVDALKTEIAGLKAQLKVAYDTIKAQELEIQELKDRRDDALTRPIFKRTLPRS
jgi:hypothetical protein